MITINEEGRNILAHENGTEVAFASPHDLWSAPGYGHVAMQVADLALAKWGKVSGDSLTEDGLAILRAAEGAGFIELILYPMRKVECPDDFYRASHYYEHIDGEGTIFVAKERK